MDLLAGAPSLTVHCLVSLSPGHKGNNGVMGEDIAGCDLIWSQDVFHWTNRGPLWCVSVRVCLSFLVTCLREVSYQNLWPCITFFLIRSTLSAAALDSRPLGLCTSTTVSHVPSRLTASLQARGSKSVTLDRLVLVQDRSFSDKRHQNAK